MRKASPQSNFRDRLVSFCKLTAGEFHSELPNIGANGTAVMLVERTREMRGMNTSEIGEFGKVRWVGKMGFQNFPDHPKPLRYTLASGVAF